VSILSAVLAWFLFLLAAVACGGIRDRILAPRLGLARARRLMTLVLCLFILGVTWVLVQFHSPVTYAAALATGVCWTLATFAFECIMGRVGMKLSWREIFAEYAIFQGRLWPLVLLATLIAPAACVFITA